MLAIARISNASRVCQHLKLFELLYSAPAHYVPPHILSFSTSPLSRLVHNFFSLPAVTPMTSFFFRVLRRSSLSPFPLISLSEKQAIKAPPHAQTPVTRRAPRVQHQTFRDSFY